MNKTVILASIAALTLLTSTGCNTAQASTPTSQDKITVLALDTSESAKSKHEELYNRIVSTMESMSPQGRLVIFRFDSSPAEFYDGKPILDGAQAGRLIKTELGRKSNTQGTNLAKLLTQIDHLVGRGSTPLDLKVFTDCGTEKMTTEDNKEVETQLQTWTSERKLNVSFHGVVSGHRERLRDLVPNSKFD